MPSSNSPKKKRNKPISFWNFILSFPLEMRVQKHTKPHDSKLFGKKSRYEEAENSRNQEVKGTRSDSQ
jgi:hypothetical protein